MSARALRTEKLDLRVSRSAKRTLEAAASVSHRSVSAFVLAAGAPAGAAAKKAEAGKKPEAAKKPAGKDKK